MHGLIQVSKWWLSACCQPGTVGLRVGGGEAGNCQCVPAEQWGGISGRAGGFEPAAGKVSDSNSASTLIP